jgi:hypothetical protein
LAILGLMWRSTGQDSAQRVIPQITKESIFEQYDVGQMVPVNSPLASIDSDWMRQLIDIWFSIHPVPVLISKTLLLQSIKDGVYDQALLAILLSEAMATWSPTYPNRTARRCWWKAPRWPGGLSLNCAR